MPLKKNDEIALSITDMTADGSGIGKYDGIAVFVANTAIGDEIKAHIIKSKKSYAIAKTVEIIKPSPDRIQPDCPVFSQCGGCVYRHITYDAEKNIKWRRVRDALKRIGGIDITPDEIIGAENISHYRNKAQYPVGADGGTQIGFYAPHSHRIVDCRSCKLQPSEFEEILEIFDRWISENKISVYNGQTHTGYVRHIYLRRTEKTGQIMVCAVVNGERIKALDSLVEKLKNVENVKSIVLNRNKEKTNVILGEECQTLWGEGYIEDELCSLRLRISPLSFYQVNSAQTERLYQKAKEYACLDTSQTLVDLYCGIGAIGLTMAKSVKRLIGVETVEQAVENAKINAGINSITNAEFICGDAADLARELAEKGVKPDVIISDPPRKGCDEVLIRTINQMSPERIVYVSCDPATLARDCKRLGEYGYQLKKAAPLDLFPRTAHVETVVLMSRVEGK